MNNIAICIPTFLRDKLLYKTLQTIVDNYSREYIILVADQGYSDSEKNITIDYYKSQIFLKYYKLPFDCGLGYARNFLVRTAYEQQIPYVLLSTDAIQFTEVYNFNQLFNKLDNKIIINFKLNNDELIPLKDVFLAKTEVLIDLWDNEMKLYEYSLALYNCIKSNCTIEWNNNYHFQKVKSRASKEYQSYWKRIKEFKKLSEDKLKELCI